jgi:CubicO group peptidase (beta-lactamase class C family)
MRVLRPLLVASVFASFACSDSGEPGGGPNAVDTVARDGATYFPAAEWRTARPEQVGIDARRIDALAQRMQSNAVPGLNSLVIIREGYLVFERYFNGSSRSDVHTMQSVSKSVTSLIAGIAADQGKLDVTASIFDVLPTYQDLTLADPRKRNVTVRQLLEMRSGINFYESPYPGSPLERLNNSRDDWVRIALEPPMNANPGELWQYNSGGVIVIAAAVRRLTGVPFHVFARTQLFSRIGVTSALWYVSYYDSLAHAGGGLNLVALDLARIGYLVLRNGRWGSDQIVSEAWLRASLAPVTSGVANFGGHRTDYGRLWWSFAIDANGSTANRAEAIYAGIGNLNQWLFVVPRYDLVVVVTGQSNASSPASFFFSDILPAVRATY